MLVQFFILIICLLLTFDIDISLYLNIAGILPIYPKYLFQLPRRTTLIAKYQICRYIVVELKCLCVFSPGWETVLVQRLRPDRPPLPPLPRCTELETCHSTRQEPSSASPYIYRKSSLLLDLYAPVI